MFRRLRVQSGVTRLYPHLLRHSFATRYLENGGNIYALQQILGHSTLDMVKKYLHLSQRRLVSDFERFSPIDCLANKKTYLSLGSDCGAPAGTRIPDTLIKSQVLYRLSYRGV